MQLEFGRGLQVLAGIIFIGVSTVTRSPWIGALVVVVVIGIIFFLQWRASRKDS